MKVSGVLAWHPQVAMTTDEIDEFLSGRWIARLATHGTDGYPHIAPLWYYWDGESFYVSLTRNRQSCKNLKQNPRCSVVIDLRSEHGNIEDETRHEKRCTCCA